MCVCVCVCVCVCECVCVCVCVCVCEFMRVCVSAHARARVSTGYYRFLCSDVLKHRSHLSLYKVCPHDEFAIPSANFL